MKAIITNGGALISPMLFSLSETAFINTFPNDFKVKMFSNCNSIIDCDKELKALYAIHGKKKKVKKSE